MKKTLVPILSLIALFSIADAVPRAGRLPPVFDLLKPGEVQPLGWLRDWSRTAADGYITRLNEVDPEFVRAWTANFNPRGAALNWPQGAWSMEGGSYWFEGLVRLAWALDDANLKALAKTRLDPVLDNMTTNAIGYIWWMDRNNPDHIAEIADAARGNGFPVWASGQLSRAIIAYYEATQDPRALRALEIATNDRRFTRVGVSENLVGYGVDAYRLGGDAAVAANLEAYYQADFPVSQQPLYRYAHAIDTSILDMDVRSVKGNKRPWYYQHGVLFNENLYTWLKRAQWTGSRTQFDEVLGWFDFVETNCQQPHGLYVADESFGYPGFRRGTETCTIAGGTFMRLNLLAFTADGLWGDRAERGFFNAGAACVSRDFMHHCYFQAANRFGSKDPTFDEGGAQNGDLNTKHSPLCCTAALCRIIPECIQFAWMKRASDEAPVAALYGPYRLETTVKGTPLTITTRTAYPFEESILMDVLPAADAEFPLLLRVPSWCKRPTATIGGEQIALAGTKGFATLTRRWTTAGTTILLNFPMEVEVMQGVDRNAGQNNRPWCSLSYGPLLFALGFEEKDENTPLHPVPHAAVLDPKTVLNGAKIRRSALPAKWEWQLDAPLKLDVKDALGTARTLVPYGCARIRISMFDVAEKPRPLPGGIGSIAKPAADKVIYNPAAALYNNWRLGLNPCTDPNGGIWSFHQRFKQNDPNQALMTTPSSIAGGLVGFAAGQTLARETVPYVVANPTTSNIVETTMAGGKSDRPIRAGEIIMHPLYTNATVPYRGVLRFTVPHGGKYSLAVKFRSMNNRPFQASHSVDVAVLLDNSFLFRENLNRTPAGGGYAESAPFAFNGKYLAAGQTLDFVVGPGLDDTDALSYQGDGVALAIELVEEKGAQPPVTASWTFGPAFHQNAAGARTLPFADPSGTGAWNAFSTLSSRFFTNTPRRDC